MKILYAFFFLLLLTLNFSCSDENKIAAAFSGDKELGEGSSVNFLLGQNYPNPFNPSTVIKFTIGRTMQIKLDIYSDDWVNVRTIIDREFLPGVYIVTFNAENLPSGDYFYVMTGDGVTQIKKMKLVK
ncbi:MAG: hypothetical protein WCE54_13630 [Ignavibacteriaceae bacterium]